LTPDTPVPDDLISAFAEAVRDLTTPSGEWWKCPCGSAYRIPETVTPNMRRALWLAFVRHHARPGCDPRPE
jgi:hypothetical protein